MKTIRYYLLAALVVVTCFYFFIKKSSKEKEPLFTTTPLIRRNLTQKVNASGTLEPRDKITVGSLVAGRVVKIYVDENDQVKKNQLLVTLDDGTGDWALKRAQAALQEAQAQFTYQKGFYSRQKKLYEAGQIAQDTFELQTRDFKTAQARLKQAKATVVIEQQNYDNLFIKSPGDGIVIARQVDLGQMITSVLQATELFKIAKDLKHMEAHIDVDEADIGLVREGQDVTFYVDAFPGRMYNAQVKQINFKAKVKESVVTYTVILDVDNPDLSLRPSMTTNVDIVVAHAENALCIANKTLRINDEALKAVAKQLHYDFIPHKDAKAATVADLVWIVEDKTFKQIKIKPGVVTRRYTHVRHGLAENAIVISQVVEPNQAAQLLKQAFGGQGIGKK